MQGCAKSALASRAWWTAAHTASTTLSFLTTPYPVTPICFWNDFSVCGVTGVGGTQTGGGECCAVCKRVQKQTNSYMPALRTCSAMVTPCLAQTEFF